MWGHHAAVLFILATEAPTAPSVDLSPLWLQYGAIGLMCALLLVFAYRAYKREADRADRSEAEVARLNAVMRESEAAAQQTIGSMREMITFLQTGQHVQSFGPPPQQSGFSSPSDPGGA